MDDIVTIIASVISGGAGAALISLARAWIARRKIDAEADSLRADAETERIQNALNVASYTRGLLENLQTKFDVIEKEFAEYQKTCVTIEKRLLALESENDDLRIQSDSSRDKEKELFAKIEVIEAENKLLRARIRKLENENRLLRGKAVKQEK